MAGRYDVTVDAGATFSTVFTYKDANGVPIDLTGYTAQAMLRDDPYSQAAAALTLTPTIDGPNGTVTLAMTAAETSTLTLDRYVYAIELTASGGEPVIRLVEGTMTMSPEVVR